MSKQNNDASINVGIMRADEFLLLVIEQGDDLILAGEDDIPLLEKGIAALKRRLAAAPCSAGDSR